jgi:hypothetical protein
MKYLSIKENILVITLIALGLWRFSAACFGAERPAPTDIFPVVKPLPLHLDHSYCPICGQPLTGCSGYGVAFAVSMGDSLHAICQKQSAASGGGRIWCDACVLRLIARSTPGAVIQEYPKAAPASSEATDLLADPIPRSITDRLLEGHGFTAAQRTAFAVVRILPLELGGTNAPSNLRVIPAGDAPWRARAVALVLLRVRQNQMSVEAAAQALSAVEPPLSRP